MKKYLFIILGIIIIFGLIIGGCGEAEETTPATTPAAGGPKYGGTMRFIADSSPVGNIGWAPDTFTVVGQYFLFDGLVKDWWGGEVTPALATSWDIDMNEPSITFHLRKGVKFHDGTDFNAEAVKFNYDAFIAAMKRPDWKSVDVIDEYTVKITLNSWRNTILRAFESDPIVSPTAVKENGVEWAMMNPVGTGPFIFESFEQDVRLTGVRNPDYWDEGKPYFDRFEVIYVPDFVTQKAVLLNGDADAMLVEFGKQSADFMNVDGIELFVQPQATAFMVFDDLNPDSPFYDQRVREAVDYAIDREWLAENLGYGLWEPCYQISPRPNLAYDPDYVGRKHDKEKARQLLAEAGYPDGFKTELLPCPLALNRDIWVAVQSQLAEVGIDAELRFLEMSAYSEYRHTGTWTNAIIADQCPSWGNMAVGLDMMFGPDAPFHQSRNKARPDWVAAINAATTSPDWEVDLIRKAERLLYDTASVIPVCEAGRGTVYWDYLKDGGFGERGAYFWAWAWESAWFDK